MDQISVRLYELLKNHLNKDLHSVHPEESSNAPFECWNCAEIFFVNHKCEVEFESVRNSKFFCTFEDCNKNFKKLSDLKKHQDSTLR